MKHLLLVSVLCMVAGFVLLAQVHPMLVFYVAGVLLLFGLGIGSGYLYDLAHVAWLRWRVKREVARLQALLQQKGYLVFPDRVERLIAAQDKAARR